MKGCLRKDMHTYIAAYREHAFLPGKCVLGVVEGGFRNERGHVHSLRHRETSFHAWTQKLTCTRQQQEALTHC